MLKSNRRPAHSAETRSDPGAVPPPSTADAAPVRLYLLGTFRIEHRGAAIHLPRRKVESLLAYLVLHPEEHTRDQLATLFWGDFTDDQARASLRNSLTVLRKTLGDELLLTDRETIQLNPAYPLWVDARQISDFTLQIADLDLSSTSSQSEIPNLQSEIAVYRELLPELYDDWVLADRERLRAAYLDAQLQLIQQWREQSEYERAIEWAKNLLTVDRANEPAHQHLMFCYAMSGNRSAALAQYEECVKALRNELAVEPSPETTALYEWIKQTPESQSSAARLTNLPMPVSSFIGRKRELAEVKGLLGASRLVSLIGAGGSGKTRLAGQVAAELLWSEDGAGRLYKDGVWWVELAAMSDPALVPQAVARALGVREAPRQALIDALIYYLRPKQLLVILDNCEHLIDASAQLAETLLRECPHLTTLVTSREALGITGETVWRVPTLSVPTDPSLHAAQPLQDYESVQLFVERARAINSDFALTDQNAISVAQICQRLDGIPLAIELAAARLNVLTVEQIAARLADRFKLLTSGSRTALPRQQTLRALIDWSYDLLFEPERVLFRRLSVFAGGFTLDAAEQICGDALGRIQAGESLHAKPSAPIAPVEVLDLLGYLVNKSLVVMEARVGAARYQLLETIREYAAERLLAAGESERIRDRHLEFFADLAETAEPQLKGAQQSTWLSRLELEHVNLITALQWSASDAEDRETRGFTGLRLAGALYRFWSARGHFKEGREWLERLMALHEPPVASDPLRQHIWAKALYAAGLLADLQGDYARGLGFGHASLEGFERLGDKYWRAASLLVIEHARFIKSDFEEAITLGEASLSLYRELGDAWGIGSARYALGSTRMAQHRYAKARAEFEEGLIAFSLAGDQFGIGNTLTQLAYTTAFQGDDASSRSFSEQALQVLRPLADRRNIARALQSRGVVEMKTGEYEAAFADLAASLAAFKELGERWLATICLQELAGLAVRRHQLQRAALLLGAVENLYASQGAPIPPLWRDHFRDHRARVESELDPSTFSQAWAEGHSMTMEQAIDYALAAEAP